MQKNRDVLRQVGGLAVALLVCIAVMLAVYALLGRLNRLVLLGAVFGWILAVGNFLSLSITVSNALDRAANGDILGSAPWGAPCQGGSPPCPHPSPRPPCLRC